MAALTGKVAIVTGSSRGIGRGIAERLGRDGAAVVVTYAYNRCLSLLKLPFHDEAEPWQIKLRLGLHW